MDLDYLGSGKVGFLAFFDLIHEIVPTQGAHTTGAYIPPGFQTTKAKPAPIRVTTTQADDKVEGRTAQDWIGLG